MKTLIIALAAAGLMTAALPQASADAGPRKYRDADRSSLGRLTQRERRRLRRQRSNLPIRITRPPNTGHYIHQDYPLWAARAFQPTRSR